MSILKNENSTLGSSSNASLARAVIPMGDDFTNTSLNNDYQVIPFGAATYDTDNAWDEVSNSYVIPSSGDYRIDLISSWRNNGGTSNDPQSVHIRINGADSNLSARHDFGDLLSADGHLTLTISGLLPQLSIGDVITVELFDADDAMIIQGAHTTLSISQEPS